MKILKECIVSVSTLEVLRQYFKCFVNTVWAPLSENENAMIEKAINEKAITKSSKITSSLKL